MRLATVRTLRINPRYRCPFCGEPANLQVATTDGPHYQVELCMDCWHHQQQLRAEHMRRDAQRAKE